MRFPHGSDWIEVWMALEVPWSNFPCSTLLNERFA
jgi:hypothetical protein